MNPETGMKNVLFAGLHFNSLRFLVRYLRTNAISGPDGTPITLALPAVALVDDEVGLHTVIFAPPNAHVLISIVLAVCVDDDLVFFVYVLNRITLAVAGLVCG